MRTSLTKAQDDVLAALHGRRQQISRVAAAGELAAEGVAMLLKAVSPVNLSDGRGFSRSREDLVAGVALIVAEIERMDSEAGKLAPADNEGGIN